MPAGGHPPLPPATATSDRATTVPGFVAPSTSVHGTPAPPLPSPTPLVPPADGDATPGPTPSLARNRRRPPTARVVRLVLVVIGVVAVAATVAASYLFGRPPSTEERYLTRLEDLGLRPQFDSDADAVANAERVCRELDDGARPEGYDRDLVGVQEYCPEYEDSFITVPTPEDLAVALGTRLRAAKLDGEYASEAAAVARARDLCDALASDGAQRGSAADAIAVDVFCPELGRLLEPYRVTTVLGRVVLRPTTFDPLRPSITATNTTCEGTGELEDYHAGTRVVVRNGAGDELGRAMLSQGRGSVTECVFTFAVEVTEGEGTYEFEVGPLEGRTWAFEQLLDQQVTFTIPG